MPIRSSANVEKAFEVLLYVASRIKVPDIYHVLKAIYFADKQHLGKYGRLIYGDCYCAMQLGPVPSLAYDIVKWVRGDRDPWTTFTTSPGFAVNVDDMMITHRAANLDLLSESDVECLDKAIEQYGNMSFGQLKQVSHEDEAFRAADADEDDTMSLELIAQSLPNGDELLEHLRNG